MVVPIGWVVLPALLFNLLAFIAVGWDKRRSIRGSTRVPERTLLLLGLPLASPGLLLAMRSFRHKTRKRGFQLKTAAVVFANLLIAAGLSLLAKQGVITFQAALY